MDFSISASVPKGVSVQNQNIMANSADPDETAHLLFAEQLLYDAVLKGLCQYINFI